MPTVIAKATGAGTSLGTSTADIQLGGASQYTPEWARRLLGLRTSVTPVTMTTQLAVHGTAWISTNSFAPNPSTVLWLAENGSVATNSMATAPRIEYFPMNYKVHGGEPYDVYMKAAVANTAAPYGNADVFFGDETGQMPSYRDSYPGVEQYYDVADKDGTATASAAQAFPAFTITGALALTELLGYMSVAATAEKKPVMGFYRLSSNGFDTSPVDFIVEPINGSLGTVTSVHTPNLSRCPIMLGTSPTTVIGATYNQGAGVAITTDVGNVGVAFVRDWGR